MFSGIVQKIGSIKSIVRKPDGSGRLTVHSEPWSSPLVVGESIANNGVCLTVTQVNGQDFSFDVLDETFNKTNLGDLRMEDIVNLERALRVGDVIGGHFVTGHVDGTGVTSAWEPNGRDFIWCVHCPKALTDGMVPKGSIAIDGISLTIVAKDPESFSVSLVQYTQEHTNLSLIHI